ncbi:MAG: hypothetical protein DRP58_00430 [Spirochaetes bacterium]|nr:MAG: hypothetical protein DRP58_00430 [Spirochaetota bacterium]
MKNRKFILLISSVVLVLLIAGFLVFFFLKLKNRETVYNLLKKADSSLSSRYYGRAYHYIILAVKQAKNPEEYISVLKRAFLLSKARNDYSVFLETCKDAYRKKPGNGTISVLLAFGMLKSRNVSGAYNILINSKYKPLKLKSLKESMLGQIAAQNPFFLEKMKDKNFKFINIIKNTGEFNPEELERIGEKYGNSFLVMDSSLLYAREGNIAKAISTLSNAADLSEFTDLMTMYLYDSGHYAKALDLLDEVIKKNPYSPDKHLIKADILYLSGNMLEALKEYKRVMELNPSFSWKPYYNAALIYNYLSDFSNSLKILNRSISLFPEKPYTWLLLMKNYIYLGKLDIAEKLLEKLKENFRNNPSVKLEILKIYGGSYPQAKYYSELWKLFNENPGSKPVTDYLVNYLLETGETESAVKVLNIYIRNYDGFADSWWHNYRAVSYAVLGDLVNAHKEFVSSISTHPEWTAYYNFAVLEEHESLYSNALKSLKFAENLIKNEQIYKSRNIEIASIRYLTGKIYHEMGDDNSARRELKYSVQLNSNNLSSILLLKELEDKKK